MSSQRRRNFLKTLGVASTVGLAGCAGGDGSGTGNGDSGSGTSGTTVGSSGSDSVTLTWADHWPEGANVVIADEGSRYFMNRIEEETNVQFDYYPAGELGGPGEFAELLNQQTIDIGPVSPQYTSDLFPISQAGSLPGQASTVEVHTNANWDLLYPTEDGILYEEEWAPLDYRPLLPYGSGPMRVLLKGDPIQNLDELKGLRIRSAGGINEWTIEATGASPVSMSASEGYTALERGTLDGNTAVIDGIYAFSFQEVTDYIIMNAELNHFIWCDTIRTGAWEKLSSEQQETFNTIARETIDHFIQEQTAFNESIVDQLRQDMTLHQLTDEQVKQWETWMRGVADTWISDLDNQELGRKAADAYVSAVEEHQS